MMKKLYLFIVATLFVLTAATVQASILFQQTSDNNNSYYSNIPVQQMADDFSISSASSITSVKWSGVYVQSMTDAFTLRFYANNSGSPGSLLASYNVGATAVKTDTGVTSGGYESYAYNYALSSAFVVEAGKTYWISILNGDSDIWAWNTSAENGLVAFKLSGDSGHWNTDDNVNVAFELDGSGTSAVPEPATMLLLGLGLAGVAVARKKFHK